MFVHRIDGLLAEYGAGLVGVVVALEAMGLPLPGESMIIGGALYGAATHRISLGWLLFAAIVGAITGDNAGYVIGRGLGFRLLAAYGRRVGLSEDRLILGRYLFRRFGGGVVFVARFVAILRTFAALLAGANRMQWSRFLFWNALGGTCWAGGYGLTAYYIGTEIRKVQGSVAVALGTAVGVLFALIIVYLRRNEHRLIEQARSEARAQGA